MGVGAEISRLCVRVSPSDDFYRTCEDLCECECVCARAIVTEGGYGEKGRR